MESCALLGHFHQQTLDATSITTVLSASYFSLDFSDKWLTLPKLNWLAGVAWS